MCDPSTVGSASLGMQSTGVAMGTVGAYFSSLGQKTSMNTSADLANINAKVSEQAADSAMIAGGRQQQEIMMNVTNATGAQTAEYGAHGVTVGNGGTPGAVKASTQIIGGVDEATANANAVRQAWGFKTQATNEINQGLADKATANGINPFMAGGSTLLTGAGSVASSYYKMMNSGAFGGPAAGRDTGTSTGTSSVVVPSPYTQLMGTTSSGGY